MAGKPDDDASLAKPSMELSDLVPPFVIDTVRDRLIVGVADAEAGFEHRADEGLSRHRHVRCCNALQLWPIFYAVDT